MKKIFYRFQGRIVTLIIIIGAAISGCFPADEGALQASMSFPLEQLGVTPTAVNNWLDWYDENYPTKTVDFDLGAIDSDFYLGLHVENAESLIGVTVTYNEMSNTIIANVQVLNCNLCVFNATIFTASNIVGATTVRMVTTYWGRSSEVITTEAGTYIDMAVNQLETGYIICRPNGTLTEGVELSAVDAVEEVRFPAATWSVNNDVRSILLPNIPRGRKMNIEIRKSSLEEFSRATYQEAEISVVIPETSSFVDDCFFDLP